MSVHVYRLEVIEIAGRFQARVIGTDDGGDVVQGESRVVVGEPVEAVLDAVRDCTALYLLRSPNDLRGPAVVVEVPISAGWPTSNLHRRGCKHSPTVADDERFAQGETVPCAKCGAQLVPVDDPA